MVFSYIVLIRFFEFVKKLPSTRNLPMIQSGFTSEMILNIKIIRDAVLNIYLSY